MKLTILGTGNAKVTKCYNTCFVLRILMKKMKTGVVKKNLVPEKMYSLGKKMQNGKKSLIFLVK